LHRVRLVDTFSVTLIVPEETPLVSSVISLPVVDESVPPLVDHE
jgi:hypothetical protein